MFISLSTWLILLVTIGCNYSSMKIKGSPLSDQEVNLNDQPMIQTFVQSFRREYASDDDSQEEKKLRLWDILKKLQFGENIVINPQCTDSSLLFSCFNYPKKFLDFMNKQQGDVRKLGSFPTSQTKGRKYSGTTRNIGLKSYKLSAYAAQFNDPLWNEQFYVQDYRTTDLPVMDMNVVPVYKKGITGKGVRIAVVDNGIDVTHKDLRENVMMDLNFDYCSNKPGCPLKKEKVLGFLFDDSHGTQVAGIIAMIANNNQSGVGIAFNAKFAGVRYSCDSNEHLAELYRLTGNDKVYEMYYTSRFIVSKSLVHRLDIFDIYQNSWGPDDFPVVIDPIHHLEDKAFMEGISKGRNGKGAIYTFSVGNGKKEGDNCAYDGKVNHIATIGVAAVAEDGKPTYYSERCGAIYTTAYGGNGNKITEGLVSPATHNSTTTSFHGTSAATPIVSGIIALALEANPKLTYRDVMHLVVHSSEVAPLANNRHTWRKNAAGFWVSMDFGFGLLNAERMVSLAKKWTTVPEKLTCTLEAVPTNKAALYVSKDVYIYFNANKCYGINYLEQVEVIPHIQYQARGAISIYLTSPKGTTATIIEGRSRDTTNKGFFGHSVKSLHFWGENPNGQWQIGIATSLMWRKLEASFLKPNEVEKFEVKLHGTYYHPKFSSKTYDSFRLRNGIVQY